MPSAFAVLTLMTRSNFVGRSTGMSEGLAPLRIRSTTHRVPHATQRSIYSNIEFPNRLAKVRRRTAGEVGPVESEVIALEHPFVAKADV